MRDLTKLDSSRPGTSARAGRPGARRANKLANFWSISVPARLVSVEREIGRDRQHRAGSEAAEGHRISLVSTR